MFGVDAPKMLQVAFCESSLREYDPNSPDGLLHGIVDHDDLGLFQINVKYNAGELSATTTDITTAHGNIMFAKYLFDKNGLSPWSASRHCRMKLTDTT